MKKETKKETKRHFKASDFGLAPLEVTDPCFRIYKEHLKTMRKPKTIEEALMMLKIAGEASLDLFEKPLFVPAPFSSPTTNGDKDDTA